MSLPGEKTRPLIRVGHKGADHVAPGNTTESFEAALDLGVDMIEFDVMPLRDRKQVVALLMTVLTPFHGPADRAGFTFTPLAHLLWQGTTEAVPTTAFECLAIGALLWGGPRGRAAWHGPALLLVLVAALELVRHHGQRLRPGQRRGASAHAGRNR